MLFFTHTLINSAQSKYRIQMLPSNEMIIGNVDEKIPLVINKFEIQSCVRGFDFFQCSWQPKLTEILNACNEDEPSYLLHDRYAITRKYKN